MNKKLKIASAAVAVVMAGTMAFGMFGCNKGGGDSAVKPKLDANGKLTYDANTQLNVNIIDSANTDRHISYDSKQLATSWKGLDGETVTAGSLKPAWKTFGQTLGIQFKDTAVNGRNGEELSKAISEGDVANHQFINASAAEITGNMDALLDINQYLDYMPNYKAFLDQSPVVKYSLTMNTANGAMYYIPYFDGNDDIEKYSMVQRQWVRAVLDDSSPIAGTTTFKAHAEAKGLTGTAATAVSFMGSTAADNWVVETTKAGDDASKTVWVKCDYGKALDAVKGTTGLGAAYTDAAGVAYDGTSGNIVDIMNKAIEVKVGAVTGAQLAKLLREYIKVAYYVGDTAEAAKTSTTAMYAADKLADVFNSTSAAWDADLMTAMFRCVVTNYNQFPGMSSADITKVWALAGREMKAQRENDLIALAGELYGVRGLESRLEYTYINSKGVLSDARQNVKSYDAAAKLHALAEEGLLFNTVSDSSSTIDKLYNNKNTTFMLHDYAQTQTTDGFKASEGWTGTTTADAFKFDFAPILTAVSKWDTNDDGTAETVMRFTESWRSVKNTGVCIPKAAIGSDSNKLSAVLAFVDYLYSNDGQIVGSYGNQASGKTASDGYWYGNPVTETIGGVAVSAGVGDLAALKTAGVVDTNDGEQYFIANTEANKENRAKYFMYGNKIYTGIAYKDRQIPAMTDNNKTFFLGGEVEGSGKMDTKNTIGYIKNHQYKYTDYARGVVGAALPIGNKDQGFEFQCTAACALDGSNVVATALNNGTIKHVTLEVDPNNWWYTEAATVLPVASSEGAAIKAQTYLDGSKSIVGMFNPTSTAGFSNVYIDIAFWGYNTNLKIGTNGKTSGDYEMKANAAAVMAYVRGYENSGLDTRITYYSRAWGALRALFGV